MYIITVLSLGLYCSCGTKVIDESVTSALSQPSPISNSISQQSRQITNKDSQHSQHSISCVLIVCTYVYLSLHFPTPIKVPACLFFFFDKVLIVCTLIAKPCFVVPLPRFWIICSHLDLDYCFGSEIPVCC